MGKISIIIPIYNGEQYIENLVRKIRNQHMDNFTLEIIAPVSNSMDKSYELAKEYCDLAYIVSNFNHAKTRHEAALKSNGDVLVFITQDILPYNEKWLSELVSPLLDKSNNIVATYSRQVAYPDANYTEKLIREFNYPEYDRLCNSTTIEKWGRKNIFYSDSASATLREYFFDLGGYDFAVGTNEDVIYALNVIESDYSVLYNSKSKVYHSHNFKFREAYSRYKLIGSFEKEYEHRLKKYSSLGEGKLLLKYLLVNLISKLKLKDLSILVLDLGTRYIAYKKGYNNS